MTEDEQVAICKRIAEACMWGQGGIASVILEDLDRRGPTGPRKWRDVYADNWKVAQREHMGVITDEAELSGYLRRGYWLVNFDEDGCSLFNPPPMNGLCKYVSKELADAHQQRQERMEQAYRDAATRAPTWTGLL